MVLLLNLNIQILLICIGKQLVIFYLIMKKRKQIQWPFHVKRTRMKDSIIKCKQIIQNYAVLESELKKNNYQIDVLQKQKCKSNIKMKAFTYNNVVNEHDLFNNKVGKINMDQMKSIIKLYQFRRYKQAQHQMQGNGLAIRKINKDYISSRNVRAKTDFEQQAQKIQQITETDKKYSKRSLVRVQLDQLDVKQKITEKQIQRWLIAKSVTPPKTQPNKIIQETNELIYNDSSQLLTLKERPKFDRLKRRVQSQSKQVAMKHSRPKQYLWQKMANIKSESRQKYNPIYQKRIKSYTEFIWKLMIAHNVYLNLDLHEPAPFSVKLKAFISYGNNCNMIKGLIQRRFWWTVVDQFTEDCSFAWSQLKIGKIFRIQQSASQNKLHLMLKQEELPSSKSLALTNSKKKGSKQQRKKMQQQYANNRKIMNQNDLSLLRDHIISLSSIQETNTQQQSYSRRAKQINNNIKKIIIISRISKPNTSIEDGQKTFYKVRPIIHNHLQNNYFLGNKKALFHNLKNYYSKIGGDVFNYLPLTFHIKLGFKDIQYKRFVKYYQDRSNLIKLQQKQQVLQGSKKHRNIWIVKPGQNSNRGRGITVIDQIYQLDNIIRKSVKKKTSSLVNKNAVISSQQQSKTFIVQMYIDRPFLYNNRKFDIRHYMLMTNLYGVTRAYWYEQGYIRTSSYQFDINNFQQQIHLTNDAIQKQYLDYGRYQPYNKLSYSQFQNYLNSNSQRKYNFRQQVLPKMKKMATDAAKSVYTRISPKQGMHNFQIFGIDYMIDKNFKPWLIEINTNPCLDCSCPLLDRIIPYMVEQSLKLSLDIIYPPPSHYPNSSKHYTPYINLSNFKYQLIFDSIIEGEQLSKLFENDSAALNFEIGQIDDDEVFKDDGSEIKLQDYT